MREATPRRDPGGEEEAESWPLNEALLQHHIDAAERAEVDADLEETRGDLCESRARASEAGSHYYQAG